MYQFRWVNRSDLPWLSQAAALGAWESLSPEERASTHPAQVAQIAQRQVADVLAGGSGSAIVAEAGGQPAGFVLFCLGPDATTDEVHGLLLMLFVAPQHRRRGLARVLQRLAEGVFAQLGTRKVKIWSGLHNQAAMNLARQSGYTPEGLIGMKAL